MRHPVLSTLIAALALATIAPQSADADVTATVPVMLAQASAAPSTVAPNVQTEIQRRRVIVQPLPDSGTVSKDVQGATDAVERQQRSRQIEQDAR
jgi:hypothetical protein